MTRFLVPLVTLALIGAGSAQARTAVVRYSDLNLASAAGQAELDRRVDNAARRVCSENAPSANRLEDRGDQHRCKAEVRAQVRAAIST